MINVILSLLLISGMREMGIALATAISAWINTLLLFFILRFKKNLILDAVLLKNSIKITISVIAMYIACYMLNKIVLANLSNFDFLMKVGGLLLIIICCKIIYLTMIFMLKVLSIQDLKGYIKK